MSLTRNFAMTPEEMQRIRPLPDGACWMSCHFSPHGLTDLPREIPQNSLLILDDREPYQGVSPGKILDQLTEVIGKFHCQALLLDLQRPGNTRIPELTDLLQQGLPCPVGISSLYGRDTEGPVFLPLLPAHRQLSKRLTPWKGREIWLEVGPAAESARVTETGTTFLPAASPLPSCPHRHEKLLCHYGIEIREKEILFTLLRTAEDLKDLTQEAEELGVTRTIGLYQELF